MLRGQYGTATPSSLTPVVHREDAQPNEGINKRFHKLPPAIRSTAPPSQTANTHYKGSRGRGGYSNGFMSQRGQGERGPWTQYAIRGNPAWRGRGKSSSRGSYSNWNTGGHPNSSNLQISSPSASSSSGTPSVRASPVREAIDPGPSHLHTYPTTFSNAFQNSATPPITETLHDFSWMNRSRSPTPKLPACPLKRRKIEVQPLMPPPTPVSRLPLPGRTRTTVEPVKKEPVVKQEHLSPSPPPRPIFPERKLITESCKFYPFPESCKRSDPDHKQNRRTFFLEKHRELLDLGLKRTKAFSRDDGLVIEWISPVPVWSDTLKPEVVNLSTVIQRAYENNCDLTLSSAPVRRKKRAASHRSDSTSVTSQTQTKNPIPPTLMGMDASSSFTIVDTPPPIIPPIPRKRLPLPGRQTIKQNYISVPVAFSPRHSSTTSLSSTSTSTLLNILKQRGTLNLPTQESTPAVAIANQPRILPSLSQPALIPSEGVAEQYHTQTPVSIDGLPDLHYDALCVTTTTSFPESSSNFGAFRTNFTRTPGDDEDSAGKVDDDCVEAEDVAISLLNQSPDKLYSDGSTDDDGASEIEGPVADFLQRYCQLFDSNRSKLAAAYDRNAFFSCCVHHLEQPSYSMAGLFAPEVNSSFRSSHSRGSASTVSRGRAHISDRLLSMGPYQFCPRGVTGNLLYDVVDSAAGILLTVHGEVVNPHVSNPHMDHVLTLDQSFVLRQRGVNVHEEDDDGINELGHSGDLDWPLVAISHQMTVRAAPLLSTERLEDSSPWIREIIRG